MFYSLDVCLYLTSESEWINLGKRQGIYYKDKDTAFNVAKEYLDKGYCVKLVKHDGDYDEV